MTTIESKHLTIAKSASEVYEFLIQLHHIELLLPKDKISNFTASADRFSFKITGAIPVELQISAQNQPNHLQLKTTENNSFPFTLDIHLKDTESGCEAYQICNADINTFMKMMIEKPLAALFDYMVDRLQKVHEA
ncbi:MAG TPA: hypothetical protein VFV37_11670 [Luteibaculaceae bacterium]|nr:hypothetical protein [Luteibaculaceae bacterium]